MSKKKTLTYIIRSTAGTFISRFVGLFRDTMVSHFFTPGNQDIFNVAFKIPNTFRSIFAEGAMTNSFVPVLNGIVDEKDRRDFLDNFFSLFLVIIFAATILLIVATPLLMPLLVEEGFDKYSPDKTMQTVILTRYLFSYLFLISVITFFSCVMNSMFQFFIPSLSQVFFNIAFVLILVVFIVIGKLSIWTFIWSVIGGGIIQLIFILFFAAKAGIRVRFKLGKPLRQTIQVFKLMLPSMMTSSTYQINIFISTYFLSMYQGGNAFYYNAQRIFQLPVGLFTVAMGQVFLPSFSKLIAGGDHGKVVDAFRTNIRLATLITIPIAGFMMALSFPITKLLFFHGKYPLSAVYDTALIFMLYMPGMIFLSYSSTCTTLFYSYKSWKSQFIVSLVAIALYYVNIKLMIGSLGIYSLAIANTINTVIQAVLLCIVLNYQKKISLTASIFMHAVKVLFATALLSVPLWLVQKVIFSMNPTRFSWVLLRELIYLVLCGALFSAGLYLLFKLFRVSDLDEIISRLKAKFRKGRDGGNGKGGGETDSPDEETRTNDAMAMGDGDGGA